MSLMVDQEKKLIHLNETGYILNLKDQLKN